MNSYEIIITPDAESNMFELRDYIANVLLSPDTALAYVRFIRKEIGKLAVMPERIKLIDGEPWHSRGLRRLIVKNFYVYYRIDEDSKRVYIMNILYNKCDQLRQLSQTDIKKRFCDDNGTDLTT